MRSVAIILFSLLAVSAWAQAPIYRQFFTTNAAPVVEVVAGSNATVQFSTPAVNTRRYTVNAIPSSTATNVYGTNVIGAVAEATHATNADYASYSGYATNAGTAAAGWPTNWALSSITNANNLTNWASIPTNYVPPQATHATNADYVTVATLTNQIDTTSVIGDAIYGGTILATNGYASGPLTVATLPGSPSNGQMVWCSDVVTTRGTGDYVYYDGSSWRNREHVVATTDIRTFILNCWAAALNASTPLSTVWFSKEPQTPGSGLYGYIHTASSFGGAATGNNADTAYGTEVFMNLGTGTAGGAVATYPISLVNVSGEFIGFTGNYRVSNLSDNTDTFWVTCGTAPSATTNYPTSGAFFLYDTHTNASGGVVPSGATSTYTNNWIAVTCQGSSYTYTDTTLPVSNATGNNRLGIILTTTNCVFYTNGVAAVTHTTTIPTTSQHIDAVKIVRVAGTTARYIYWTSPGIHIRQAANRTY